ncbi:allatostatin-A receptor-like [Diadema antillarum]|uniref:allatostatin-A receptor-like n=1 Tax=Diadema antillarum TaxID=105358 RepID=UPI003A87901E
MHSTCHLALLSVLCLQVGGLHPGQESTDFTASLAKVSEQPVTDIRVSWTDLAPARMVSEFGEQESNHPKDLDSEMGHLRWRWVYPWKWYTIVQLMLSSFGIVGNLLVILALIKRHAYTHSTDIFIGGLAVADFMTSVLVIPVPVFVRVPDTVWGAAYCRTIYTAYFYFVCLHASVYTLTGMSVERCLAVVYPLRFKEWVNRRTVHVYLTCVWIFAASAYTFTMTTTVNRNRCHNVTVTRREMELALYVTTLRFGVPSLVMIVTQTMTMSTLRRHSRQLQGKLTSKHGSASTVHSNAQKTVVKMTLMIVLIYVLSLGPQQVVVFVAILRGTMSTYVGTPLYNALNQVALVNACSNPLIYAARYRKFRIAIRDIFKPNVFQRGAPLFDTDDVNHSAKQNSQKEKTITKHGGTIHV